MTDETKREIAERLHAWGFLPSAIHPRSEYYVVEDDALASAAQAMAVYFQVEASKVAEGTLAMKAYEDDGVLDVRTDVG